MHIHTSSYSCARPPQRSRASCRVDCGRKTQVVTFARKFLSLLHSFSHAMSSSLSGKAVDKTPAPSRHPLHDITNSSSIRPTRQSSLLDHFPTSSDTAPSSPASHDDLPSNHDASTSSPCANTRTFARESSALTRSLSFPAIDQEDPVFSERVGSGEEERVASKRRRSLSGEIGEATLVRTLDASARRKLPSQQIVPGQQLSAYAMLNRRSLGLRVSTAQGQLHFFCATRTC